MRRRRLLGGLAGAMGLLTGCSSGVIVNRPTPATNASSTPVPGPPTPRVITPRPTPTPTGGTYRPVLMAASVRSDGRVGGDLPAVAPGAALELVVDLSVWSHAGLVSFSSQILVTDEGDRRIEVHREPRRRLSAESGPARVATLIRIPTDGWSTGTYEAEVSVRDEVNDRVSSPVYRRFALGRVPTPTGTPTAGTTPTPTSTSDVDYEIRVNVIYAGGWFGDLIVTADGETETTAIDGDHTRTYEVDDDATELVVRAQKLDDSRRPLTVQIVVDGDVVADRTTNEPGGSIHLPYAVG